MRLSRRHALASLALGASMVSLVSACTTTEAGRQTLEQRARVALDALYRQLPAAKAVADRSRAVLVFPAITQGGFGFGGQYGRGVLFKNGQPAGYYSIAGGSFGMQIGAQTFSQGYFFTTQQALDTFEKTQGIVVGAGVDFAVADIGASGEISTATLQKPLIVFVWGQQGLMAGVKVEGQKITRLESQ